MSATLPNLRLTSTFGLEPRYVRERRDQALREAARPVAKPVVAPEPEVEEKLVCMDDITPMLRQRVLQVAARHPWYLSAAVVLPVMSTTTALMWSRLPQIAHAAGVLLRLL